MSELDRVCGLSATSITTADKLKCAQRELNLRLWVYRNRVMTKRMTQAHADREIATMRAIVEDYQQLAERERLL
jgi:hypothetical protein